MKWHTQVGIITTNPNIKIVFTLPEIIPTKIGTWNCQVDYYAKGRYDMTLVRYLLTYLGLNLKRSDQVIEADYGILKGSTAPMVDMGTHEFKYLNIGKITPE